MVRRMFISSAPLDCVLNIFSVQPFAKTLSKEHILSDALPIYRKLASDDQDSVRLLTIEDMIAIAQQLSPAEVKEQLLKQIRQSMADKSWRVRYMSASHFNEGSRRPPFHGILIRCSL